MYERTNYLAVGAFILLGTIALIVVGFWIGGVGQTVPTPSFSNGTSMASAKAVRCATWASM
jgi:ABC-type transporter Mla subunit MlaD